jgi:hypothetical protein
MCDNNVRKIFVLIEKGHRNINFIMLPEESVLNTFKQNIAQKFLKEKILNCDF